MAQKQNVLHRFNKYTKIGKGCWEWIGGINSTGRGVLWLDGKWIKAHRLSWTIHFGDIPNNLLVCHKCDNGRCVNPSHLFLGTHKDNARDMINKGRNIGNRRLTNEQNKEIIDMYNKGVSRKDISGVFNLVSYEQICKIIKKG